MELAIALIVSYLPFLGWALSEAKADLKEWRNRLDPHYIKRDVPVGEKQSRRSLL